MLLHNMEEAEDVTENVFLKTFTHMKNFDIERDFKPWLSRIVLNESRNYYKKNRNSTSLSNEEDTQLSTHNLPNEKVLDLKNCIDKLSKSDKELVTLRFYQEFTIEEISKILNIRKNTVKVRIHRAMKKLKEYLKNA
jgi:RNA polymerase sigma-70 factor, ECF subfamily